MLEPSLREPPLLVLLHFLGGSAKTWDEVVAGLGDKVRCLPLDLPGFGDDVACGMGVADMADRVSNAIAGKTDGGWLICGHSMGAKVSLALARRAEDGDETLADLLGLILISGSPPTAEPMDEAKRTEMIRWIDADHERKRASAKEFIGDNAGKPLTEDREAKAVAEKPRRLV